MGGCFAPLGPPLPPWEFITNAAQWGQVGENVFTKKAFSPKISFPKKKSFSKKKHFHKKKYKYTHTKKLPPKKKVVKIKVLQKFIKKNTGQQKEKKMC